MHSNVVGKLAAWWCLQETADTCHVMTLRNDTADSCAQAVLGIGRTQLNTQQLLAKQAAHTTGCQAQPTCPRLLPHRPTEQQPMPDHKLSTDHHDMASPDRAGKAGSPAAPPEELRSVGGGASNGGCNIHRKDTHSTECPASSNCCLHMLVGKHSATAGTNQRPGV